MLNHWTWVEVTVLLWMDLILQVRFPGQAFLVLMLLNIHNSPASRILQGTWNKIWGLTHCRILIGLLDGSSVSSVQQSTVIGARFGVDPVVPNIAACVDAAYAMIPVEPPKPVWEQGVCADIFGDGVFLKHSWTSVGLKKLPLPFAPATSDAAAGTDHKKAKRLKVSDDGFTHEDIVINKTDQTWQEERESLVQCALKRWLVVSSYFQAKTVIRTQLDGEPTELGKLTLLARCFQRTCTGHAVETCKIG